MKLHNISKSINIKNQFSDFFKAIKHLFPKSTSEFWILSGFFLLYSSYGIYLSLNSSILDWEYMWVDRYLSFDNPTIFHSGILGHSSHPILIIFMKPILVISSVLISISGNIKIKTVFISIICAYMIASSVMYIYRYMRNVVQIKKYPLYVLSILYGFFFTNLILSFTIETYTFSIFILSYSVSYYSIEIKNNRSPRLLTNLSMCIALGGITITNIIKGLIPMFFTKDGTKVFIQKSIVIGSVFLAILIPVELKYEILQKMILHYNNFALNNENASELVYPFYRYVIDLFLGAPILYPGNTVIRGMEDYLMYHLLIIPSFYEYIWQYIFIGMLYSVIILSIIKNRKNKYMQMLVLLLFVDLLIHIMLKYGVRDYIIFGGHWVYIIPLIIAWLYKSTVNKKAMNIFISLITILLIANNLYFLADFIKISIEIFPLV